MKRVRSILCVAAVTALAVTSTATAQSPVQLSLFNPVQIVPEGGSVQGLSLGLAYTVNEDVTGVAFTLIVNKVTGDMKGWQGGFVNLVDGEVWGYQEGFVNKVQGNFYGWQAGWFNINDSLTHGLQTGIYNQTNRLKGVQFGVVNTTDVLNGLQIGLLNINTSGDPYGLLPIVNWSF